MSTVYGRAAVAAAKELHKNKKEDPANIWFAKVSLETDKYSSQVKACPKSTFLYLCHKGYIRDVEVTMKSSARENGEYANQMINKIKEKGNKITKDELNKIIKNFGIKENGQVSVVFELYKADLLKL